MKITDMHMPKQALIYGAIYMLANRMQTLGDRIDPTVSSKQWFLLAVVLKFTESEMPPSISDAAEVLGTSRQNTKKMANILEQRGFIKLEKDKNDSRVTRLVLTEKCRSYLKGREQQENEYLEGIFSGIDDDTLTTLCNGLDKLLNNIDTLLEGNGHAKK